MEENIADVENKVEEMDSPIRENGKSKRKKKRKKTKHKTSKKSRTLWKKKKTDLQIIETEEGKDLQVKGRGNIYIN